MTTLFRTANVPRLRPTLWGFATIPFLMFVAVGCAPGSGPGWGGAQVLPSDGIVFASPGGRLYRLDPGLRLQNPSGLATGEWQFPLDKNLGPYYAPPAVSSTTVFAATGNGKLIAVDRSTGQQLWEFPPPRPQPAGFPEQIRTFLTGLSGAAGGVRDGLGLVIGSPALAGNAVVVGGSNHRLYAVDAKSGGALWEFQAEDKIWSSPAVAGDTVYVGSLDHRLYALDAATGNKRWAFEAGGAMTSSPFVMKDTVYIGAADRKLYALDTATGALRWSFTAENWFWTRPIAGSGVLFAGALDHRVYALDLETGRPVWPQPFQAKQPIVAAPIMVDGTLIVAAGDGTVYGLDARQGTQLWTYLVPNAYPVYSNIATDGATVYVTALDNQLYALDAQNGSLRWTFKGG